MVGIIGFIIILITFYLNRKLAMLIKSKALKYFDKTQNIDKSLLYLKGFNKIYIFTGLITIVALIFGSGFVLYEFFEYNSIIYFFIIGISFILYYLIASIIKKI